MGNINYDSFYKFLVSLGIILVILPFTVLVFFTTNSFDLQITEDNLEQYTQTAQKVIAWRQSIPLLIQGKYIWGIVGACGIFGVVLILYGMVKWHEMQKIDDMMKKSEFEKKKKEIEKNTVKMTDAEVIKKMIVKDDSSATAIKNILIEQKFFEYVRNKKKTYIIKRNIMIRAINYDVVAFSTEAFEKDYVYEIKYLTNNESLEQIEKYREKMVDMRNNYSDEFNRIPYMVLEIIVPDEMYEDAIASSRVVKKWNNYAIEVLRERDLDR